MDSLVDFTNTYAAAHIGEKKSYADENGQWIPTTREEMYKFIALLIFQAYYKLPAIRDYWRTTSLFDGNYARAMIPNRVRFESLLCFLKAVDPAIENAGDCLRKVRFLYDHMQQRCQALYKPGQFVSVDERMIKCKGRVTFKQYLPKKPVKWGFKVFAVCDAATAMLCNFQTYTGQGNIDADGLTHTVMNLTEDLAHQGYVLFTDNF